MEYEDSFSRDGLRHFDYTDKLRAKAVEKEQVFSPAHYTDGGIETIDFIKAKMSDDELRGYCIGNALKYLSRAGKKGDVLQDLKKARWYLDFYIEGGKT
jgi:hypothetical protein